MWWVTFQPGRPLLWPGKDPDWCSKTKQTPKSEIFRKFSATPLTNNNGVLLFKLKFQQWGFKPLRTHVFIYLHQFTDLWMIYTTTFTTTTPKTPPPPPQKKKTTEKLKVSFPFTPHGWNQSNNVWQDVLKFFGHMENLLSTYMFKVFFAIHKMKSMYKT